jgi:hypothetical protein
MTAYGMALTRLAAHFKVTANTFEGLPRTLVMEWAAEVGEAQAVARIKKTDVVLPLRTWQHRFLIGEDGQPRFPRLTRTKLVERLSHESLMALSQADGRSIKRLLEAAEVGG